MMKTITAKDGHSLNCWFEQAKGDRIGGIVILQEIFGVTDQLKGIATKYADLGYEVAIPALFDRKAPGTVIPFDEAPRARDMMLSCDLEQTVSDIDAAVTSLAQNGGKVAVIGFCWGGGLALRATQSLDVAAGVSFYGTRLTQYLDQSLGKPFLGHFGLGDDHVPVEMVEEAQAAFPEMEVHMYDAGHAFANELRPSYVPAAAEVAHARTAEFLATHLR